MKKNNWQCIATLIALLIGVTTTGFAQTDRDLLNQLVEEDQKAISALVLYPEDVRMAILEASIYPEALIKMEAVQTETSKSFRNLMETHPRSTQEMLWDLTRYPDLIGLLTANEDASRGDLNRLLVNYPEVAKERAITAHRSYFPELVAIYEFQLEAERTFAALMQEYPTKTRDALQQLVEMPEVLTILTDHIRLTILVGDLYQKDTNWLLAELDRLNLEVAQKQAKELEEWKESLENNPEAKEQLTASAEAFGEEHYNDDDLYYGDDLYYDGEEEEYYNDPEIAKEDVIVEHHYHYSYPYWLGYPHWYYFARWRPYPYWYDWGFYYGPGRSMVIVGLPSYYFMNWYFYHPYHHYRWGYLSAHFVDYSYYGPRTIGNPIVRGVNGFRHRNEAVVTETWLRRDDKLVRRFEEFGTFETARIRHNNVRPQNPLSQKEYLERHNNRFPETRKVTPNTTEQKTFREPVYPRTYQPTVPTRKPKVDSKQRPPVQRLPNVRERTTKPKQVPRVNQGRERHKNIWDQSRSSRQQVRPRVTPQVRKAPTPTRKTTPRVKRNKN